MAKMITPSELAKIVTALLNDPSSVGQDMTEETYGDFMTAIAEVVCNYCGGEVHKDAMTIDGDMGQWLIGIHGNDSLPEDGGVWAQYDPEGGFGEVTA